MAARLDPRFFPHIVEDILRQSDRRTLFTARLVCASMRDLCDRLLVETDIILMRYDDPRRFTAYSFNRRLASWTGRRIPCFHPGGSLRAQHDVIRRVRYICVNIAHVSQRLIDLLHFVHPMSNVRWSGQSCCSADFAGLSLVIPPCASLELVVNVCCCFSDGRPDKNLKSKGVVEFRHSARHVILSFFVSYQGYSAQCRMTAGVLNPMVSQLTIIGYVPAFATAFKGRELQVSPRLQVHFEVRDRTPLLTRESQRAAIANCLGISQENAHWKLNPLRPWSWERRSGHGEEGESVAN